MELFNRFKISYFDEGQMKKRISTRKQNA